MCLKKEGDRIIARSTQPPEYPVIPKHISEGWNVLHVLHLLTLLHSTLRLDLAVVVVPNMV